MLRLIFFLFKMLIRILASFASAIVVITGVLFLFDNLKKNDDFQDND